MLIMKRGNLVLKEILDVFIILLCILQMIFQFLPLYISTDNPQEGFYWNSNLVILSVFEDFEPAPATDIFQSASKYFIKSISNELYFCPNLKKLCCKQCNPQNQAIPLCLINVSTLPES